MFAHGRPGIFFLLIVMLASRSKTRNKSHNILQAFRAYLQNTYSSKKKSWKSVARYPEKIRGGQVDFSKRSTLLFLTKFVQITFVLQIHLKRISKQKIIMKMHSKTKNIKRENHERPGKISWIESMSASSIFHLLK